MPAWTKPRRGTRKSKKRRPFAGRIAKSGAKLEEELRRVPEMDRRNRSGAGYQEGRGAGERWSRCNGRTVLRRRLGKI